MVNALRRERAVRLLVPLFFVSGLTALIYQSIWARQLQLVFGTSQFAIATVLAAFMAGLAAGGFLMARYADRLEKPLLTYGVDLALLHGNPAQLQAYKRQANWPQGLDELNELINECQEGMARINNLVNDLKSFGPTDQAERDLDLSLIHI